VKLSPRRASVALLLTLTVAASGLVPAMAATPPVALATSPSGLTAPRAAPDPVEDFADWQPQVSCSPVLQRGVAKLRNLALSTYGRGHDGGIPRSCAQGGSSEHKEGRAWDWMLNVNNRAEKRVAGDFLSWLVARGPDGQVGYEARRLGIMYVIYNRRIWSAYRANDGWREYNGYSPHTDHIHISFGWAGARGATSFWTGRKAGPDYGRCARFRGPSVLTNKARRTPCPAAAPLVKRSSKVNRVFGSTHAASIKQAQKRLHIAQTGTFDRRTWRAVKSYQARNDVPRTGVLDQPTWTSMLPRTITWNAANGFGPVRAARYGARNFTDTMYRPRMAGKPVLFAQIAMRMPVRRRTGFLGSNTAARVREFKSENGLRRDAVMGPKYWRALADAT